MRFRNALRRWSSSPSISGRGPLTSSVRLAPFPGLRAEAGDGMARRASRSRGWSWRDFIEFQARHLQEALDLMNRLIAAFLADDLQHLIVFEIGLFRPSDPAASLMFVSGVLNFVAPYG